jgi:astacin
MAVTTDGMLYSNDVRIGYISGVTFQNKQVKYSAVDGLAVFEGDIILGTVEAMEGQTAAIRSGTASDVERGTVIKGQQYRWPNALMPYIIDSAMTAQNRVTDAIAHWQANVGVSFVLRTSANASQYPNYVRFFSGSGCYSYVGMQGNGQQDISIGVGCGTGAAIHEIGHSWGLWHEQSRHDRDTYVRIHYEHIIPGQEHNFDQHITDGDDVGPYDYGSIMHYGAYAFTKDGQPTIEVLQAGATIGQQNGLSAGDIAAVRSMYQLWSYNKRVFQTFASNDSQNAWANIESLGWRRIKTGSPDGITNMFEAFCDAAATNKLVHVFADGANVSIMYFA